MTLACWSVGPRTGAIGIASAISTKQTTAVPMAVIAIALLAKRRKSRRLRLSMILASTV
jgi:hypothetical protein